MTLDTFTPTRAFEAFNARFLSPAEVAKSFVPPPQYERLIEQNHTVLLGPRGSGKTTLLKMLQLRALAKWEHPLAEEARKNIPFHSIFLGTDVLWGSQLESRTSTILDQEKAVQIRRTSFRLHLALAFLNAIEECRDPEVLACADLERFVFDIDIEREAALAAALAAVWHLSVETHTFLGVRSAVQLQLSQLLALVNRLRVEQQTALPDFVFVDPIASILQAIDLTNQNFGTPDKRWAILCDELEIAPEIVRSELFSLLRSSSQPVVFKFSFFPYSSDLGPADLNSPNAPTAGNDYVPLDLTYGLREPSYKFCTALLKGMIANAGGKEDVEPVEVLGDGWFDGGRRHNRSSVATYGPSGSYYKRIRRLMKLDKSFNYWLSKNNYDVRKIADLPEPKQAVFRKALPFILTRSEFLREQNNLRSRKSFSLYTGAYSMFSLSEGNPRIFINLMRPVVEEHIKKRGTVTVETQARSAEVTHHRFKSSLSAIPTRRAGKVTSILHLVHIIGQYLQNAQLFEPFAAEPHCTFIVDERVDLEMRELVGRALNSGSLIRIEGKNEPIVDHLDGARLRLAYTLAPEYRLALTAGREVALSRILDAYHAGFRKAPAEYSQPRLAFGFDHE